MTARREPSDPFAGADWHSGSGSYSRTPASDETVVVAKIIAVGPPSVEQAKAALLALESEPAPSTSPWMAADLIRKNPMVALVGASVLGLVLSRSRLARRALMAAVVAPGVRRAVMHKAAEVIRTISERRH